MNFSKNLGATRIINKYLGKQEILKICAEYYTKKFRKPTTFNTNISQIIITYLDPQQLQNFFISFNDTPNSKYTFSAQYFPLQINVINYLLRDLTITSLNFINKSYQNLTIPLTKLSHCSIYGSDTYNTCNINSISRILHKYTSITSLHIQLCDSADLYILHKYQNLQSLTISSYAFDIFSLQNLPNCPNLHTFKFTDNEMGLENDDIIALSLCHNLIHLELNCVYIQHDAPLSCPNLRYLKCNCDNICDDINYDDIHDDTFRSNTHINLIYNCPNLRHLILTFSNLTNIHALSSCPNLRTLNLTGCKKLINLSPLTKCPKLHHLILPNGNKYKGITAIKKLNA